MFDEMLQLVLSINGIHKIQSQWFIFDIVIWSNLKFSIWNLKYSHITNHFNRFYINFSYRT